MSQNQHHHRKVNTPSQPLCLHPLVEEVSPCPFVQAPHCQMHSLGRVPTFLPDMLLPKRAKQVPPTFSIMKALLHHQPMSQTPKVQQFYFGHHQLGPDWGEGHSVKKATLNLLPFKIDLFLSNIAAVYKHLKISTQTGKL